MYYIYKKTFGKKTSHVQLQIPLNNMKYLNVADIIKDRRDLSLLLQKQRNQSYYPVIKSHV